LQRLTQQLQSLRHYWPVARLLPPPLLLYLERVMKARGLR
jgi:hypothetical protein